ncbi:ReoY family proteolytic degradation factor [Paludifilum halophilum]|uniref:IDEAL domain protein n=1 Tax=Paludifilum halophilum TaxID=1642702 RepID=A0A235BCF8_9BACL|nr:ReoY family proteolytic degradation factor [Paludifilum halophilum]OYD09971.1 IDEAL domain protein [Paludifilum halophilum]
MSECVTVSEKKEFIQWFLGRYELQKREAAWLLNYLCSDDQLLERTHFVDSLRRLPKSISISTRCVQMTPFQFTKNGRVSTDVETAFYDIRSCPREDLFISLYFKERSACPEYAAVLEVNPMERQDLVQDSLCSLLAEMILDQAVREFREKELYRRIDDALARGDEKQFLQLTEQWLAIMEKNK